MRKVFFGMPNPTAPEQGDVLYFNGTNWVVLHHGTAGDVLTSGGNAANPSWAAASGGASALDDLTDVAITSAERGDVLFRDASGWVNLHHGNAGQALLSGGNGADPAWGAAGTELAGCISIFVASATATPAEKALATSTYTCDGVIHA